ncbi:TetR/AcrR family transcriptional regulator [Hyphococcus flavus]|uniref:TetR/AcrR family transcriptional regulator n=1 Tax=Hyphococcus flavus TaxID=1866326 RepID=A0AAF0CHJ2_9PROT|nr:TetR/AcrR family transcriptional regulator [Hyphococcus flavus]WDI31977.1 TetR/AcrR family transcriptional regulator [Hyphococcus flavus]
MTKGAVDRRSARTRQSLHDALYSLILEKGYDGVSINDVCAAANISRSTFYAHYANKDDLKRSGLDKLRQTLAHQQCSDSPASKHDSLKFSLAMFEHARDHIGHYRALADDRSRDVVLGYLRGMLADLVRRELSFQSKDAAPDTVPPEFKVQFVVGAFMAVLVWWLDGGAELPPCEADAIFRRLAEKGLDKGC